jgi:hypothetical protein
LSTPAKRKRGDKQQREATEQKKKKGLQPQGLQTFLSCHGGTEMMQQKGLWIALRKG